MRKVLFVSYRFPLPLTGGDRIRIWNDARMLSAHYDLDLVALVEEEPVYEDLQNAKKLFKSVKTFKLPKWRSYLNVALHFFGSKPLQVSYFNSGDMENWIKAHGASYDAIFCLTIRTAEYARFFRGKKILDMVDAISFNYNQARRFQKKLFWKIIYEIEISRLIRYEKEITSIFDTTLLISKSDISYLVANNVSEKKLDYIAAANGNSMLRQLPEIKNSMLFFAKLDYEPNSDAAIFFANEVFPRIRSKIPDARFLIAGLAHEKIAGRLQKIEGVEVLGFVEDLDALISRCSLVVSPVRFGAGVQNKIIHAMALGKCVITNALANDAIGARQGIEIETAQNAEEMAIKIVGLLENPIHCKEIGDHARAFVIRNHGYDLVSKNLFKAVSSALEE